MGYSRSAYYKGKKAAEKRKEQIEEVIEATKKYRVLMPRLGTRKLYYLINKDRPGLLYGIGRDKYFRLLGKEGLLIKRKRKYTYKPSDALEECKNLKKGLKVDRPNQLIETDTTYIQIKGYPVGLLINLDVYTRRIISWLLSKKMGKEESHFCLQNAVEGKEKEFCDSYHHSDRGSQFLNKGFIKAVKNFDMKISFSAPGTPTDAAFVERINNTLKNEFDLKKNFTSFDEAHRRIQRSILIYNEFRPHLSLQYKTPAEKYEEYRNLQNDITSSGLRPSEVIS